VTGWGGEHGSSLGDIAADACIKQGAVVADPIKPTQEWLDQQKADADQMQPMEVPTQWKAGNAMENNFLFDAKCVEQWQHDMNILRLRVIDTTPESWPIQLEAFREHAGKSATLKIIHSVRDPLDIIISGYFYDAAGSEPACRDVPSSMLKSAQHLCGDHDGDACKQLLKIDYKTNSWSDALQKLPPKHGVVLEALAMYNQMTSEATSAAALKKQSFAQVHQLDLGDVMSKFDATMKSALSFLGVKKAEECVKEIKDLDVSTGRSKSTFSSCVADAKKNGIDVSKLEGLLKKLGAKDVVNQDNWYTDYVKPVEMETPDACAPCGGEHMRLHTTQLMMCHSASAALDPVREYVRDALKATVFYKKQINPLRAIMGYN